MNPELAKTLTTALVQFIDKERPEGTMCCSNPECEALEQAFIADNFFYVETLVQRKLSRLTEFEEEVSDIVEYCKEHGKNVAFDYAKRHAKTLLALAKKELLKDNELGRKHLEGYIMGRNDALREMSDFMESHFNTKKAIDGVDLTDLYNKEFGRNQQPACLRYGGICYNPMRDCINCPAPIDPSSITTSGTSTAKVEG